jgi:CCR4-NOT transcriptional regulation complex NOT5 subunit
MLTPFDFDTRLLFPLQSPISRTIVVSDTIYKELQKEEAQQNATILRSKINRHKAHVADLEKELQELQETYGLLPESAED